MLRGSLAAAVTPLSDGGAALDEDAVAPYVDFLAAPGRLDGILALGTTGEGILLSVDERKRVAERFIEAGRGRLQVAIHAGAQTTADTVELAAHAADRGADAVAVIGPPYFTYDEEALYRHFAAAAEASGSLPVLPLRVQGPGGLLDPAAGGRAARRPGRGAQGLEPAVRSGRAVPPRGAGRLHRRRVARGRRASSGAPPEASPASRPPSRRERIPRSVRFSSASRSRPP